MNSAAKQGDLWGQAPRDWALIQEPQHTPLFEAMLSAANVGKDVCVLDAGCGGGGASLLAVQRGAQIAGLDAAEGLINGARERVPAGDFRVGDIQEMPYANDSFDAVLAANSIQYADDQVAALRELRRVCKAEGRIVVALFAEAERVEYGNFLRAMAAALSEAPGGGGAFALSTPGTLESLAENAGLTVLDTDEVNCPFAYPDFETFWRGISASGPSQGRIRLIGADKLKSTLRQASAPYVTADGSIDIRPNYFRFIVATV
jgi:SAM-dependent methyltransferase